MKKLFVPYEIALKLKKVNFNEPCLAVSDSKNEPYIGGAEYMNHKYNSVCFPLYQQVIDWLEKEHKLLIHRVMGFSENHICYKLNNLEDLCNLDTFQGENALNETIKEALKII